MSYSNVSYNNLSQLKRCYGNTSKGKGTQSVTGDISMA